MSIFRETFPAFIQNELGRRQDGMATRNAAYLHQLNSRSAWVRMTSGVNFEGSSALAKKYVMQGGVLNHSTKETKNGNIDVFTQKNGLGNSSNAYSNLSQGGAVNRAGIKPMPGITNVAIQSKGAYGSLQEATVTFNCWDIRQLEELELLYMRPGYTVLLEFGWDFARVNGALPSYDILNKENITLNDAFAQIYKLIDESNGTYDALLGYVKNYNWSARDDGGYDCTTSIISLGEVLESLKCNWVPGETIAFDNSTKGILQIPGNTPNLNVLESYEKGIIPGLLQELWNSMEGKPNGATNVITDPNTGNYYYLYKLKITDDKNERGGLPKPLGTNSPSEVYITLGSFCDLLSTYVFPKGAKNQPLSELVTYETDYKSKTYIKYNKKNSTNSKESLFDRMPTSNAFATSLKCIASPLALSTNLGVCYVKNDNWNSLEVQAPSNSFEASVTVPSDIFVATSLKRLNWDSYRGLGTNNVFRRFAGSITKKTTTIPQATTNVVSFIQSLIPLKFYSYSSALGLQGDIDQLAKELGDAIIDVKLEGDDLHPVFFFADGNSFTPSVKQAAYKSVNLLDYFGNADTLYKQLFYYDYDNNGKLNTNINEGLYEDPFSEGEFPTKDNKGITWTKASVIASLSKALSNVPLNPILQRAFTNRIPEAANQVADAAANLSTKNALPFLVSNDTNSKQLGYISNIYVNLNYLYEQAISKNIASNDNQNKNTISIRDYIQGVMRDVQNSLGNINSFDIQVDNRNAIGRIIDINFTGNPTNKLFTLQLHNLNSSVRDYKFSSKIFPEMGSIIAISAQDATGIGKLGYDNATLVAWNEGIKDRLIPKKDFNSDITLNDPNKPNSPATFLLPFLTKINDYFQYLNGKRNKDDNNYAYGGLDFAYRDFLSNLDRFDPRNKFKTIIPTELTITLDGIGGIIIGNLFKINQDIVPKGYRNIPGRDIAYIVTRLGHQLSGNDWTTELSAYPVVFENTKGVDVWKKWKNNPYPGSITIRAGRNPIINIPDSNLLQGAYSTANDNNPFNIVANNNTLDYRGVLGYKVASNSGLPFLVFDTEANGVRAGVLNLSNYFTNRKLNTVKDIINTYAPPGSAGQTAEATNNYIKFVTNYLKTNWNNEVTSTTTLTFKGNSETNANNIKMFKTLVKGIIKQEGKLTAALASAIDNFDTKNL
jgi:hypothetical protein